MIGRVSTCDACADAGCVVPHSSTVAHVRSWCFSSEVLRSFAAIRRRPESEASPDLQLRVAEHRRCFICGKKSPTQRERVDVET